MSSNKNGRNDPCPCGSGKKYKKCCLNGRSTEGTTDRVLTFNTEQEAHDFYQAKLESYRSELGEHLGTPPALLAGDEPLRDLGFAICGYISTGDHFGEAAYLYDDTRHIYSMTILYDPENVVDADDFDRLSQQLDRIKATLPIAFVPDGSIDNPLAGKTFCVWRLDVPYQYVLALTAELLVAGGNSPQRQQLIRRYFPGKIEEILGRVLNRQVAGIC